MQHISVAYMGQKKEKYQLFALPNFILFFVFCSVKRSKDQTVAQYLSRGDGIL